MSFSLKLALLLVIGGVLGHEDDVHTIKYTTENFAEELPKKNHFIMFYAPWCGHCQAFAPTWEQLAEMLNEDDGNIRIAKVDCTSDKDICSNNDITGYPTLKFFKAGSNVGVKFRGTRDLPTLTNFINEQLREGEDDEQTVEEIKVPRPLNGLLELTEENYEKHINDGHTFVKFYAPWCGHCQKLAPIWEELAKSLEFDQSVTIAKIDCTQHRTICNQFDIKAYPTLLWLEDGKKIDKYQGERTHESLKQFVDKMRGKADVNGDQNEKNNGEKSDGIGELNGDNFHHGISDGLTFVKFFAPWCGHCKRLAPTWEELSQKFHPHQEVHIVKIDCTQEGNKKLCSEQEVEGFPTIFLYKNGEKITEYRGSRTLDDLYDFVKKYLGKGHDEL